MNRWLRGMLLPALMVLLPACVGTRESTQHANREMAQGSVVGQASPEWDAPARLVGGMAPVYPIGQLLNGKTGHAEVAFTVGEDGRTRDISVTKADREVFGRHLAAAVKGWRFEPATKDGKPVASRLSFGLDFVIERNFDVPESPADKRKGQR